MDHARFAEQKTGELVRITSPGGPDWAFLPAPLLPAWKLPDSLIDLAMEAWDRLGTLNGIGNTLPTPELLLRPLEEREALQSSKLEGTYASPEELLLFAKNPREPKSDSDPANEWREVSNYLTALRAGIAYLGTRPASLGLLLQMHHHLLTGVRGREKMPGQFRHMQVGIGSDHRFVPPPAMHLPEQLENLERHLDTSAVAKRDRLAHAFIVHYQFEAIHPFLDGNGRIGRVLLALMIYKACGHSMPWLYLSPFFERYKEEYIDRMFRVSTHGEWTEWVAFCLRGTIAQCDDSILRCKMLLELQRRYHRRVANSSTPRTHRLIESLFTSPGLSVAEVQKNCGGTSYKTAKTDIQVLVKADILKQIPDYYPANYYAWEIFRVAYRDEPTLAPERPPTPHSSSTSEPAQPLMQSPPAASETSPQPAP